MNSLIVVACKSQAEIFVALDTYTCEIEFKGKKVSISLWETPGREDSDRLRALSYPNTDAVIICICIGDWNSLRNIKSKVFWIKRIRSNLINSPQWFPEVRHNCPANRTRIILVCLKTDLRYDTATIEHLKKQNLEPITFDQGQQMCTEIGGLLYVECSPLKDLPSVITAFEKIFETLMKKLPSPGEAAAMNKKRKSGCIYIYIYNKRKQGWMQINIMYYSITKCTRESFISRTTVHYPISKEQNTNNYMKW